ncbi:halocyanin domain-containing protein [Halomarina pelagica]|uniref:halocyanin domain-containing protein n=1 Tax=Halomarina pelagica TaxID=2961599 RepID=UPI0020C2999D|nr:halocyanin domain-containing protein [Halomarina sp. BND7]
MRRREFLLGAGGAATAVSTTGAASAQEGNSSGGGNGSSGGSSGGGGGPIDYGGWLDGANGWSEGGTVDARGKKKVTIKVGAGDGYAFDPVAVHVDKGATIVWEWTGQGGAHNVHAPESGAFKSDIQSSGTFKWKATGGPVVPYQCDPHAGQGMKGALAIGDNVPRKAPAGPVKPAVSGQARTVGVATMIALMSTLGLGYFFMKYGGDYE